LTVPCARTVLLVALLALALFAGCVDLVAPLAEDDLLGARSGSNGPDASREGAAPGGSAVARAAAGDLRLFVHARDLAPIANATVTVDNRTATTGADGIAKLRGLPVGLQEARVEKPGYRAARLGVEIHEGVEAYAEATLALDEGLGMVAEGAHDGHVDARVVLEYEGYFDCSATYVIITGDCLTVVQNVTSSAGAPVQPGDSTNEANAFDFPLDLGWKSAVLELEWTQATTSVSSGMSISVEPTEAPADGHAARYARVEGESILRMQLDAGVKHETATADDMPNPLGGELVRARVFLLGEADNPGGTDFLGVGASLGQRFTLYVTVFYDEVAPASYTIKGGA
jgi:hypothetical protein